MGVVEVTPLVLLILMLFKIHYIFQIFDHNGHICSANFADQYNSQASGGCSGGYSSRRVSEARHLQLGPGC